MSDDVQQVPGGGSRVAKGDPFDDTDAGPWIAHGIAIPEGATTMGQSEKPTRWPESTLRASEGMLTGQHLMSDRNHTTDDKPGVREIVGEVTDDRYIEGLGLSYQAEIDDRKIAQLVARSRVDGSPMLYRTLSEPDSEGVRDATKILGVDNMGVVREGAGGEATTIQAGPSPSLASEAIEALSQVFTIDDGGRPGDSGAVATDEFSTMEEAEYTERIAELENERDGLADENMELRGTFAESLSDSMPFDAETIAERFDASELVEALEASDESDRSAAEILSGSVEPRSGGENPGEKGAEALSASEKEALRARREALSGFVSDEYLESLAATGD